MSTATEFAQRASWWASLQGLTGELSGASPAEVLSRAGWARSVGGVAPYLTFFARSRCGRTAVDAALARQDIHELPAARGCTYVLPQGQYAVGLIVGQGFAGADLRTANRVAGYDEGDAARLDELVVAALAAGPASPAQIKNMLGPAIVNFGDEGKKRGVTSSLPISLGRLQATGRIRRISADGRLDSQRYEYAAWQDGPLVDSQLDLDAASVQLARWYLGWIGSASPREIAWFTGWNKAKVARVLARLDLVETDGGRLARVEAAEQAASHSTPVEPDIRLIANLDSLILLRRNHADLIAPADLDSAVSRALLKAAIGSGPGLSDLPFHAMIDRGRIIGLWDFSHAESRILAVPLSPLPPDVAVAWDEAVEATQSYILDQLGDARMMSLDSPKSRERRLAPLRELLT